MTCYDIRGQQVLDVCRAIGLRVPDDIAVVGQHNDELLCELCDPPLSSVVPDARQIGHEAARTLDALMAGRKIKQPVLRIPPLGVVARQSSDLVAVDDPRLATAMRYLRAHAFEPIGVAEVARAAGLSRSLLERRFRIAFGDTPWNFVLRIRVAAARDLLTGTSLPLGEVAERAGFVTPEHFSAMIRKFTGRTPGQIRRGI
jgi:LacI family transcriptional regulator